MKFAHISDMHLGFTQYSLEEREQDVYRAFKQAVTKSIEAKVDFVIFAGDIFHEPKMGGEPMVRMAKALKRFKDAGIESFFILGEHDISRIRGAPVPYVYHSLGFSKHIGEGKPFIHNGVLICGFDKIRKQEMEGYEARFDEVGKAAKEHQGHSILVMHQGVTEFDKRAGEIQSTELPENFTYYAMGHLHKRGIENFGHMSGPIAYPGSTERTSSEKIGESKRGFFIVDISGDKAVPEWTEIDTRPQMSFDVKYEELESRIAEIEGLVSGMEPKPIVEVNVNGEIKEPDRVHTQITRLEGHCLKCVKRLNHRGPDSREIGKPGEIGEEMLKCAEDALGSKQDAEFAVKMLLPALASGNMEEAVDITVNEYARFKEEYAKSEEGLE